tara:strand:- start:1494 stop:1922 length:429 start_codon:yes stop_codon:yes gene_type:complete
MTDRSTSDMTREELEMEVQLLRAALKRHGGEVTTTDILRVERDRNNRLAIEPRVDELATYKGRLPATVRKAIWVPSHDTPVGSFKRTHSGVQVTLQGAFKTGFLDWLDHNVNAVILQALRDYEREIVFDDFAEPLEDDGEER